MVKARKPTAVLRDAEESLVIYIAFPIKPHLRIRTTKIVERVNRERKRRCKIVSVFSDAESVLRIVCCAVVDLDDERSVKQGYFTKN
jgi:transposase-like protein